MSATSNKEEATTNRRRSTPPAIRPVATTKPVAEVTIVVATNSQYTIPLTTTDEVPVVTPDPPTVAVDRVLVEEPGTRFNYFN
jgi:hypothetical protein